MLRRARLRGTYKGPPEWWSLPNIGKTALVLLLVIEVAVTIRTTQFHAQPPDLGAPLNPDQQKQSPTGTTTATEHQVNQTAGYSFGYPEGWESIVDDTLSTLRSPDGRTVILVGVGPPGSIDVASAEFMASLRRIYPKARLDRQQRTKLGDTPSMLMSGYLVNTIGKNIRFISATIRGTPRNFQIAAYYDRRENPKRVERLVGDVLQSFRQRRSL